MPELVIVALIVLPLAAGIAAFVARRWGMVMTVAVAVIQLLLALQLAWMILATGPLRYELGGWSAPLGINLYADGLAAWMVLMTAVVGLGVAVYATRYFEWAEQVGHGTPGPAGREPRHQLFWPLSLLLGASLNALFLSGDIFNLYVSLELLTLSAVALVGLAGSVEALTAALRYLLIAVVASLFYLLGVAFLYSLYGTVDWQRLSVEFQFDIASRSAIMLILIGLLVKTALFPLHFWLPAAHASAPAPASALLSGLVLKASFFIVLRLWFAVFPYVQMQVGGQLLAWLGAGAIIWGSIQAIRQTRLKLLVAYSTVAQVGYLFLVFGLASDAAVGWNAWSGTAYFALAHACAKAAAFLAAGSLQLATGSSEIDGLAGSAEQHPVTIYAFALAGVGLMGLPPSAGFLAKWLLLQASLESRQWGFAMVMLAGGIMAAVYVFRVLSQAFATVEASPGEDQDAAHSLTTAPTDSHSATGVQSLREIGYVAHSTRQIPLVMQWTPMVLALVSVGLGLVAIQPLALLSVGAPFQPSPLVSVEIEELVP